MDLVSLIVLVLVFALLIHLVKVFPASPEAKWVPTFKIVAEIALVIILIVCLVQGVSIGHVRFLHS